MTSAHKLLPETVNCSIAGLADAEPAQAEIEPDTALATIIGGAPVGFTVISNVMGVFAAVVARLYKITERLGCDL